jgi:tetratricopeptide (TPR) repeat protein
MAGLSSRRTLKSIFALSEANREESPGSQLLVNLPLPSLEERTELFIRAVYGPGYMSTPPERAAAREKILSSMADDLARQITHKTDGTKQTSGQLRYFLWACSDVARRIVRLPQDLAAALSPRTPQLVAIPLMVLLVAGATLAATMIYMGSGARHGNSQIAANPASQSPSIPQSQQIEEATRREQSPDAGGQRSMDAALEFRRQGSRAVGVPAASLSDQELVSIHRRFLDLFAARNYVAALLEAQKLEVIARARFGIDDKRYAEAIRPLAMSYLAQGRYGEAEAYFARVLAIKERNLVPSDPDLVQALDDLAEVYQAQGRTAEAVGVTNRASTIRKMHDGVQAR